jgi:hypothetical protein
MIVILITTQKTEFVVPFDIEIFVISHLFVLIAVSHMSSNVPFSYALFTRLFHFYAHGSLQLLPLIKLILQAG